METRNSVNSCEVNKLQARKPHESAATAATSVRQEGKNNASLHGISYQLHLGLVVLLRLFKMYKDEDQFDFELTFEDPAGGKFDDVIVRYSSSKHSSKGIVRIQAKHRQSMRNDQQKSKYDIISSADLLSTKRNAAFSVGMFFKSFLDIHNPASAETQTYMLCTNKTLDTNLSISNFKYKNTSDVYILTFLQDINAKFYQFDNANKLEGLDEIMENAVNHKCTIKTIESFYDNFFVVCGSANETDLYAVAMGLLKEILHFQNITTYEKLHYNMFEAIKKGPKSFKPIDVEELFRPTEDSYILEHFRMNTAIQLNLSHVKYFDIKLRSTVLERTNLFKFIQNKSSGTHWYRSTYDTDVSIFIIEQTVKLAKYELIIIDLSSYQANEVTKELCNDISIMRKHDMNKFDTLITIIAQRKLFKGKEIMQLAEEYGMKFVIVQQARDDAVFHGNTDIVDESVETFCVGDITKDARTRLFQKCINLLGTTVSLFKIINQTDPLSYFFDLIQLNQEHSNNSHKSKYEEIDLWYVDRRFVCYEQGKIYYADDNDNLPGIKYGTNSCKIIIILNDAGFGKSSFFTKLSWRLTSIFHSSFVIRLNAVAFSTDFKRLKASDIHKYDATAVLRMLYRFIHMVLYVHDGTKQTGSDIYRRRKKANKFAEVLTFSKGRVAVDENRAKELKLSMSQLLELRLFETKLNGKHFILLFDGFDEIAPDYKEVVLKCLAQFAQLDGIRLVYISSRPYHFLAEFEQTFPDSRIYQLEPFSTNDQKRALYKYIHYEMKGLESYDENLLLDALVKDFRNLPIQMKSVPLLLRMAFDIRFPIIQKHISSQDDTELIKHESFDILKLIETFVDNKIHRTIMEKNSIPIIAMDSVVLTTMFEQRIAETKKEHALLAIFAIFNNKIRNRLLSKQDKQEANKCMKKTEAALEKTGIIVGVQDDIPQFILRIFAEYFAALWIYENLDRVEKENFFRSQSFWNWELSAIREFLDRMIFRGNNHCDIHLDVFNQSMEQMNKLLMKNPSLATVKDALGRLPLHLAVRIAKEDFVHQLLDYMPLESINVRDNLIQWSALDYAFATGYYKTIKLLLARGAGVNLDTLIEQICSNNLRDVIVKANNYGKWLQSSINTKTYAVQFHIHVMDYLFETRKLDFNKKYSELNDLTVLGFCMENQMDSLFDQLIKELTKKNGISNLICAFNYSLDKKLFKSSRSIFEQLCFHRKITLVADAQITNNMLLQQDNITDLNKALHPKICCVRNSKNVRLPLPEYDEQDVLHDGYVIEALLAKAVHYGNIEVLNYIVRKTNITITNRLIASVMRLLPKTKDACHEKSMAVFEYLLNTTTDLFCVDIKGRNLLHMTAQNGCFFMMHCLIVKGFDPALANAANGWNTFHYLAFNDREDDRSSKSLEYLMYDNRLNWLDLMDSTLTSKSIGVTGTVSRDTKTILRTQKSKQINKQQHALLGMLAVFKEECKTKLFTQQECAEVIALMQQIESYLKKCTKLKNLINYIAYMFKKNQNKQAKNISGIICKTRKNIPVFKHKLIAEYFAACWLYENKDRMGSEPFFRSRSFWTSDLIRMRYIFNRMVLRSTAGCKVHQTLLYQSCNTTEISKLLSENTFLAVEKDTLGRLPLHLAVWNRTLVPMKQLLEHMSLESINTRDELFHWSALDYAFVSGKYEAVEMLLALGARVNLEILLQQICSNNLRFILNATNNCGARLHSFEYTKAIAEQLDIRVVQYLLEERQINVYSNYPELGFLTVLKFCIKHNYIGLFKQLFLKAFNSSHYPFHMSRQLLIMAFQHKAYTFVSYLKDERNIPLPQINENVLLISVLNSSIEGNQMESFQNFFEVLCRLLRIDVVSDAHNNENIFLKQDYNIPALDKYLHPKICCVHNSKNVRLPLPEYDEQDVLHDGYVIEALLAKAVHYGNIEVLNYIVRKTNITITNRLIASVMRLLPKTKDACHEKSMAAFQYLLNKTTDLYGVDIKGRNLLHMTAQNGCFFMMHCLIVKGFDPALANATNGWNTFHYLAFNDDEDDRSSNSLEYLMYDNRLNWLDLMDSICFSENVGVTGSISRDMETNERVKNSDNLNKQQLSLLGMLAVFKEECRNTLFAEQERAEAIALMYEMDQAEKIEGKVIRRVQIFAEYFAACWLYENKDRMGSEPFFRSRSFWTSNLIRMRDIFSRMVLRSSTGCKIHQVLLDQSCNTIKISRLLSENNFLASEKDSLGRLPLHLAVCKKTLIPMKQLLEHMSLESINARDELFQWSALDYAFVNGYDEAVGMLLSCGAIVNLEILLQQICSNSLNGLCIDAHNYRTWLQTNKNTKAVADQLDNRVVKHLFEERKLNIYSTHSELNGLTISNFCKINKYDAMLANIILISNAALQKIGY